MLDVGHDHIDGLHADQLRESGHAEQQLAAGHRLADPITDGDGVLDIFGGHRLFVPGQGVRLEPLGNAHGLIDGEEAVTVDHDAD